MAEPRAVDIDEDRRLVADFLRSRTTTDFLALYRRHTPALFGFAHRLAVHGRPDADDLVQETWVRAVEGLAGFRREASLRTWLRAICFNVYREWRRKPASHELQLADEHPHLQLVEPAPENFRPDLQRAVDELPDGYREVLILHDVEGYTHQEIAELAGIEVGTSKSQLSRARRALRNRLESEEANG